MLVHIWVLLPSAAIAFYAGWSWGWKRGYDAGVDDGKALDVQLRKLDALLFKGRQPDGSIAVPPADSNGGGGG